MTPFKKAIGKLHLWLGLASGLVVFIVSITGAIFTFQDDIRDLTEPWRKVPVQQAPYVLPSRLQAAALAAHPGVAAKDCWTTYFGPARSATVFFTDQAGAPIMVSLNPYTGQVLHETDLRTHFFSIVQEIHMHLLLPEAVAKWVVGLSISIFVVMLGTGIVLWWPKRRQERRQRFTIKWGARWRRINYDLHNVLGFYAASIGLILALTGPVHDFSLDARIQHVRHQRRPGGCAGEDDGQGRHAAARGRGRAAPARCGLPRGAAPRPGPK